MGNKTVKMDKYPTCDVPGCNEEAHYDAKTYMGGKWAYLCEEHFKVWGYGLGLGKGQLLELREQNPVIEQTTRPQSWIDTEKLITQAMDGLIECPNCGESLEPDAESCRCGWLNPLITGGLVITDPLYKVGGLI